MGPAAVWTSPLPHPTPPLVVEITAAPAYCVPTLPGLGLRSRQTQFCCISITAPSGGHRLTDQEAEARQED